MVPSISLFQRHLLSGYRIFGVKRRIASSGKPKTFMGMFKSWAPTSAGDRYETSGFSKEPVTRTGIPSKEEGSRIEPKMGMRLTIPAPGICTDTSPLASICWCSKSILPLPVIVASEDWMINSSLTSVRPSTYPRMLIDRNGYYSLSRSGKATLKSPVRFK